MSEKRVTPNRRKDRRAFLKNVLIGGGAAAVTLASGNVAATPEQKPNAVQAKPESQGYHVTPHIEQYYKVADF